jgi:hypothetical protein
VLSVTLVSAAHARVLTLSPKIFWDNRPAAQISPVRELAEVTVTPFEKGSLSPSR